MVKLVFISDTHGLHGNMKTIPDGDILVHCGDGLNVGSSSDFWSFAGWIKNLPHPHKIFVPGNHDRFFQNSELTAREIMSGIHILIDQSVIVEGIKFYGSPWTPTFYDWSFMQDEIDLSKYWDMIPDDTDVLVTHGPPYSILDTVKKGGENLGSPSLHNRVKWIKPKFHAFGHIHGGYGILEEDEMTFINASVCTEKYKPKNKPVEVFWKPEMSRRPVNQNHGQFTDLSGKANHAFL